MSRVASSWPSLVEPGRMFVRVRLRMVAMAERGCLLLSTPVICALKAGTRMALSGWVPPSGTVAVTVHGSWTPFCAVVTVTFAALLSTPIKNCGTKPPSSDPTPFGRVQAPLGIFELLSRKVFPFQVASVLVLLPHAPRDPPINSNSPNCQRESRIKVHAPWVEEGRNAQATEPLAETPD